jgi:exosortase C (VPDSG-CTERM-specific)
MQPKESVLSRNVAPVQSFASAGGSDARAGRLVAAFTVVLILLFSVPLYKLVRFGFKTDTFSHVLLIPFITGYLLYWRRHDLPSPSPRWSGIVLVPLIVGIASLGVFSFFKMDGRRLPTADYLFLTILPLVCFWIAGVICLWGPARARALAFPLSFLLFTVPFPMVLTHAIESFFQHASAEAAAWMLALSGTTVLRDGLFFMLPGILIEVAEECSGIRSTLVLFITSLLGGYLFFRLPRYRAIIAFAVIPIAIVRNGFRIVTIALLCVHIGPQMIDSVIHRRGGPLFFALSLIPFFALLLLLYRREKGRGGPQP